MQEYGYEDVRIFFFFAFLSPVRTKLIYLARTKKMGRERSFLIVQTEQKSWGVVVEKEVEGKHKLKRSLQLRLHLRFSVRDNTRGKQMEHTYNKTIRMFVG